MKTFILSLLFCLNSCSSTSKKEEKESLKEIFTQEKQSSPGNLNSFLTPESLADNSTRIRTENPFSNWDPNIFYTLPKKLPPGRYGVWFTIGKTIPPKTTDLKVFLKYSDKGYSQEYTNAFLSIPNATVSLDRSLVLIVALNSINPELSVKLGFQLKKYLSQTYKKSVSLSLKLYRIPDVTIRQVASISPLQLVFNKVQKIEIPDLLVPIKK
jgi:hypothetical protein